MEHPEPRFIGGTLDLQLRKLTLWSAELRMPVMLNLQY